MLWSGCGSAFCLKNNQSNPVIKSNGKILLGDCGSDIRFALNDNGLGAGDIDAVSISHLHGDHVGGLEWLAFSTYFNPTLKRPKLYIEGALARELWDKTLRGGLECIEGKMVTLEDYFEVMPVEANGHFKWEGMKFEIVQTLHMAAKYKIINSFGLMITTDTKCKVFFTTDTQFAPTNSMMAAYKDADIIFHDCETSPFPSGVHAHYDQLVTLPDWVKARIWLYHYQDNVVDDFDTWNEKAIKDGFQGFVKQGQTYAL